MALTAKKVYAILKRQISDMEAKLNSPVRYRGTVATADLLPLNPDIGDMYNIESKSIYGEAGMNVAWNGVVWDTMGAPVDMSLYLTKEGADTTIQNMVNEYLEKNPVKPGATPEQAQQIEQNKTDIASLKEETGSLKEDIGDLSSSKISKFYASNLGETHITDSNDGKIADMKLYGRSEQKQYSGRNLFDKESKYSNIDLGRYWDNVNRSIVGQNVLNLLDKEGTDVRRFYVYPIKANSKYTLFFHGNITNNMYIGLANASGIGTKDIKVFEDVLNKNIGITTSENETYLVLNTDGTADVMLELGTEATSYEPYTGGQPSPSPDYPQEIKSVVNPVVKLTNEDGLKVQSVTLNNITLNAIPVSSGGNVTINGQQYIADYVDVERGKIIKCVEKYRISSDLNWIYEPLENNRFGAYNLSININPNFNKNTLFTHYQNAPNGTGAFIALNNIRLHNFQGFTDVTAFKEWLDKNELYAYFVKNTFEEINLTIEEIQAFKALATYYPVTNISVNSEQLDGYTIFNYPISMANGWNYVKQQLNDNRDYIYDMDARAQDTDLQAAEAYVNSEYAVALTELEV